MAENKVISLLERLIVADFESAKHLILARPENEVVSVGFVNSHAVNLTYESDEFFQALGNCDYLFRDGVGVELAFRLFGMNPGDNNCGTDLIPAVLQDFERSKVAVIGSEDSILEKAQSVFRADYGINDFHAMNGFDYQFSEYQSFLEVIRPDLLILAMGMPKQELLCQQIKESYRCPLVVINGGAIINFMTGREKRASKIMRGLKLEWFWRLLNDPKRLFSRYVTGNIKFLFRLLVSRLTY